MEEGRAELVLSAPRPAVGLAELRSYVASRLGEKARVSTLHDMLVIDVDRERLVEVATFVRDDPRLRCDLYSVNAGVDTGAELRSVTFVRGTATKVTAMLRTSCTELDPHIPTLPKMRHWPHLGPMKSIPLTSESLAAQDCVLIATDHTAYDYGWIVAHSRLVVDTRNATKKVTAGREKIVKA